MVKRHEAKGLEEFEGTVASVEKVESKIAHDEGIPAFQYEITMDTDASKTGHMFQWLRITKTSTDESVAEGSVLDYYLKALERMDKEVKKLATVEEALNWMVGKKFRFVVEKPGKAYGGKEAASVWVPAQLL